MFDGKARARGDLIIRDGGADYLAGGDDVVLEYSLRGEGNGWSVPDFPRDEGELVVCPRISFSCKKISPAGRVLQEAR